MFWLNFGTFANLDKFISRFNWKGRICGSKSTQIWSICQIKALVTGLASFGYSVQKLEEKRDKGKVGLQEDSKWVYGMERESKEGLHNIDGISALSGSGSGVIIMQRSVSDQTSAPANDIPPPVADHRSRSQSLVTERGERGDRERAQPRGTSDGAGARQSPESRGHQLFLLHSPGMRTRDIMSGYVSNLYNNVPFQQFWFWPVTPTLFGCKLEVFISLI